jgi:Aspartate/tyrosine/aromatic aminotransferase
MALSYSARSRAIEPFHVMALLARANELQAAGHDVIHLEIGEPDFTTAEPIIQAGQAALTAGRLVTPPLAAFLSCVKPFRAFISNVTG